MHKSLYLSHTQTRAHTNGVIDSLLYRWLAFTESILKRLNQEGISPDRIRLAEIPNPYHKTGEPIF